LDNGVQFVVAERRSGSDLIGRRKLKRAAVREQLKSRDSMLPHAGGKACECCAGKAFRQIDARNLIRDRLVRRARGVRGSKNPRELLDGNRLTRPDGRKRRRDERQGGDYNLSHGLNNTSGRFIPVTRKPAMAGLPSVWQIANLHAMPHSSHSPSRPRGRDWVG